MKHYGGTGIAAPQIGLDPQVHGEILKKVKVTYLDEKGTSQEVIAEGLLATVLQHELDHLQGVL